MNRIGVVGLSLVMLTLAGCTATLPKQIDLSQVSDITVDQVREKPDDYIGQSVRWGGTVIGVENGKSASLVTILARPLSAKGKPKSKARAEGRFIAVIDGFIDPAEYTGDRLVSVAGEISGISERAVGEFPYAYPLVEASGHVLWEPKRELDVVHYEMIYDPWYRAWLRYPYPR